MKSVIAICILLMLPLAAGCSEKKSSDSLSQNPPPKAANVAKPSFSKDKYPRVDGSTATIPLSEAIACELLGLSKEEGTKFIKHNTTHNAYENLVNGKADIIFVTEPSMEELEMARSANIELEVIPIVKEAFVFLVNEKNPVKSLSVKEIQYIYQGKIVNWKEVGGEDTDIVAYQREPNSGSQTLMEQMVMKGIKMTEPPKKLIVAGMEGLIESIASYDNSKKALGYSVYYYAKNMYVRASIKLIGVDGVLPDNKSISSGKYPFTSAYYAVIKKSEPKNSPQRKLIEWILSEEGQRVAEACGYVPMEVK